MSDKDIAESLLAQSKHMIVAVTLDDDTPWAVPVRITRHKGSVFEWYSRPTTVHSQAISGHPDIALIIFSIDEDIGIYAKATAEGFPDVPRDDGYIRYRAIVTEAWLNERHTKRPVDL